MFVTKPLESGCFVTVGNGLEFLLQFLLGCSNFAFNERYTLRGFYAQTGVNPTGNARAEDPDCEARNKCE